MYLFKTSMGKNVDVPDGCANKIHLVKKFFMFSMGPFAEKL